MWKPLIFLGGGCIGAVGYSFYMTLFHTSRFCTSIALYCCRSNAEMSQTVDKNKNTRKDIIFQNVVRRFPKAGIFLLRVPGFWRSKLSVKAFALTAALSPDKNCSSGSVEKKPRKAWLSSVKKQICVCVVFTFSRSFFPTTSVHPVSVLILHPREIQMLWSQTEIEKKQNNRIESR